MRLQKYFQELPMAAVDLPQSIEQTIRHRFMRLAQAQDESLKRWVAFQTTHPLVTESHYKRMHGVSSSSTVQEHRLISDEANEYWHRSTTYRKNLLKELNDTWGDIDLPKQYAEEAKKFQSRTDFLLCYAFDVFRRGWQYQLRSSVAGAVYVPHYIRDAALDVPRHTHRVIEHEARVYWSWGNYVVAVLDDERFQSWRSPSGLSDLIERLKAATNLTGCPKWWDVSSHAELTPAERQKLIHLLEETAKEAEMPLLWRPPVPRHRMRQGAIDLTDSVTSLATSYGLVKDFLRGVRGLVYLLEGVFPNPTAEVATKFRETVRPVFKGRLRRTGLYGPGLDDGHDLRRAT